MPIGRRSGAPENFRRGNPRNDARRITEPNRAACRGATMIAADSTDRQSAKLLTVDASGRVRHLPRTSLQSLFSPGDLIVANDAATLPASLRGTHCATGEPIEIRLAAWVSVGDPTRFVVLVFGPGDHRLRTEDRPLPPAFSRHDRLLLGPLVATVEGLLGHPRLLKLRFSGNAEAILGGLARHGRPIQYAHAPEPLALWDVWTSIAADPIALSRRQRGLRSIGVPLGLGGGVA